MQTVQFITVNENQSQQRVDNFLLTRLKKVPKSHIYKIIRKGEVRVNKKRIKPTYKLQIDDIVRIPPVKILSNEEPPAPSESLVNKLKQSILFEDDTMLVLNKPAGLAVHGGSGINLGAIEALRQMYPTHQYLELVHRLDRDTSGCLLVAKKRSFLRYVQNEIRERRVEKKYLTVLVGRFTGVKKCRKALLKTTAKSGEWRVRVDESGKNAHSIFKAIKQIDKGLTLAEVEILTGRTHQIRVHGLQIGHPVLGDDKYGYEMTNKKHQKLGFRGMYLHAESLRFKLADGQRFEVRANHSFPKVV